MNESKLIDQIVFALNRRSETWRTNTNDPHNINTAVYVALSEVGQAIADAKAQVNNANKGAKP